jgi:hypothetical protein
MFSVTVTFIEKDLTPRECERYLRQKFGDSAIISLAPATTNSDDILDFALDCLITDEQAEAKFSNHHELYASKISTKKLEVLDSVSKRLDRLVELNDRGRL